MAEYIELTDLWSAPFDYIIDTCGSSVAQGFVDRVNEIKPADVRPVVRGRWISKDKIFGGIPFACSNCGEETRDTVMGKPRFRFCPMCGAICGGDEQ